MGMTLAGCGGAQTQAPPPATAAPALPASTTTTGPESAPSASASASAPLEPAATSADAKCVAKGNASRGSVPWPLRARPDATATMTVEDAAVTAWVGRHAAGTSPWSIAVELENAAMKVRAFVSGEDLRFFVTKAFFVRPGWIPDGITERRVVSATDADVSLEIGFEKFHTTVFEVPCADLGVMPARID